MQKRIGEYLLEKKALTEAQIPEILAYSARTGMRFGDAAIAMGFLSQEKMIEIFGKKHQIDFFCLQPELYPAITRDLLSIEQILKYGALPLGYKVEGGWFSGGKRRLNLGLLNPDRADAIRDIQRITDVHTIKTFLVLGDQFLTVLERVYGISEQALLKRESENFDPILALFIQRGV